MTNEDIERKCLEYSQVATPSYTNGDFDRYAIAQAFEDGAEWRINSVWHDNLEKPVENKLALVKYITGDGETKFRVDVFCGYEWKEMCHYDRLIAYAYVKDLLPIKEDEK